MQEELSSSELFKVSIGFIQLCLTKYSTDKKNKEIKDLKAKIFEN